MTRYSSERRGSKTIPIDLETVTEARLVAQALAGSESAFEQIVRRYQRPIISLVARIVGDRTLAEDLAQETFVKAFRSLAGFDTTRRLSSWLFRIAHNTALDALRRSRPAGVVTSTTHQADGLPRPEPAVPPEADPVERQALARALDAAMNQLRPEQRSAIVLRYDEGLSFDEIGHVLGIPEATARSHVHRARKRLSQLLTEAGWSPER
ncbi:MAG TPA: RNA polymerase sigma factor [Vicinamibacterales bacterium]|nr:RNA polymerase sigma factor [Vicinamibacterales bacterium]